MPDGLYLSGWLLAPRRPGGLSALVELAARHSDDSMLKVPVLAGWTGFRIEEAEPYPTTDVTLTPPFRYEFWLRCGSGDRILLAASHHEFVDEFLRRRRLSYDAIGPSVDVPGLVKSFVSSPGRYSASAIYARAVGYGQSLRRIAFYGEDVASAELFKKMESSMEPYRINLRSISERADVLSIGTQGEVGFQFHGPDSLVAVNRGLAFIGNGGFIHWRDHEAGR